MRHHTLVDPATLEAHLGDPGWIVFDCRHDLVDHGAGARAYAAGHVPGAQFMSMETALSGAKTGANGRHPLPAPEAFAALLGARGVTRAHQVVAYDASVVMAARLWWMLRWLGHRAVAVLDGGYARWTREGRPTAVDMPAPAPARYEAAADEAMRIDAAALQAALGGDATLVLDARSAERFRGVGETLDPVGGHIPGAQNRFYGANLDAEGGFRPAAELRREFETLLGGRPATALVHSCGSGVSACVNLLAMEHAGLAGSRLYPGSWSEWCSDPHRPMWTPGAGR